MKTSIKNFLIVSISILFTFLSINSSSAEDVQQIELKSKNTKVALNDCLTVSVQYDCADNTVPVLGATIHYNSNMLKFEGSSVQFKIGSAGIQVLAEDEVDTTDNDPKTDKVVVIAYQDIIGGNWPGVELPIDLLNLTFRANTLGKTSINVLGSSSANFKFEGKGMILEIE
jgi:hypothetical protein